VKLAIVVQRYGADINGGAELHARYIAEHLATHVQVEVLTTCATDYISWRNALAPGAESVHGITVRRFATTRERDPDEFGRRSEHVFTESHAVGDELAWLDAEGPVSPDLLAYIAQHAADFDFFIFFSVRYYHAYYGARLVPDKAILVPTAERDAALGLSIFAPLFRGVRALMYNSFEERKLIQTVSGNQDVPGVVVGIGSEIPAQTYPSQFRQKFNLRDRFAIYVGRIDENKGCAELFDFFQRYSRMLVEGMHLVLIGNPIIPIPDHPQIHHLGFVSDQDKFDAIAASELLIMPSYFESLSMVALEAWALGKPVLANGRCDVLKGQCIRSNGGLYYDNFQEFIETLRAIDFSPSLAAALGRNGRDYFSRHYSWPVIERKYLEMIDQLKRGAPAAPMPPLAGWFARRKKSLPPAATIVDRLPAGPALDDRPDRSQESPQPGTSHAGVRSEDSGLRTQESGISRDLGTGIREQAVSAPREQGSGSRRREDSRGGGAPRPPSRSGAPAPQGPRAPGSADRRGKDRRQMRGNRRGGRPRRPGNR
jgi:glycosyltransferase involved in cell wall biosynthesis